jgi:hypothetical protein
MARKPKPYTKLARRRGGIGTYFSLWLASDHVLQVEANMITERYQRVWLRDIQGLFVRPSREAPWVIGISACALVLMGGLAVLDATGGTGSAAPVLGVFAALSLIVLLYGLLFSRNCHFHVLTAVQRTEWTNIARRRQARKLMDRLEPLILEAQRTQAPAPAETTAGDAETVSVNA